MGAFKSERTLQIFNHQDHEGHQGLLDLESFVIFVTLVV